jgi:hypothetical protein
MIKLYSNENFPIPVKISSDHEGIIVCSFDSDFKELAQRIHQMISSSGSLSKKLLRINRPII